MVSAVVFNRNHYNFLQETLIDKYIGFYTDSNKTVGSVVQKPKKADTQPAKTDHD